MEVADKILSGGAQGPSGPPGPTTAAALLAAVQAMDAAQLTAYRAAMGIATYANLAAANLELANGDPYFDEAQGKMMTATA
jgi:hypothetical protein